MRLTTLWKPTLVVFAVLAALIYAMLVIREISRRTESGAERKAQAGANHGSVEEEAILGAIWAHRRHPFDASWCPDYSPSFHRGCSEAVAAARYTHANQPLH